MEGYIEDKRVVLISDLRKDWELEDYYNMISDGFTVEGKGKPVFTIPKKLAPKLLLNTNYTIHAVSRSDRRSVHFVPISQFYGVLNDSQGKTPADVHGGYLHEEGNWTSEDWTYFYVTCIHCIQEDVDKGLVAFNDHVLHDRQLLAAASHDETLLQIMPRFMRKLSAVVASANAIR